MATELGVTSRSEKLATSAAIGGSGSDKQNALSTSFELRRDPLADETRHAAPHEVKMEEKALSKESDQCRGAGDRSREEGRR